VELHGDELWTGYSCVGSLLRMMHCACRDLAGGSSAVTIFTAPHTMQLNRTSSLKPITYIMRLGTWLSLYRVQ